MCMIRPMYDVYDMYDNIRMVYDFFPQKLVKQGYSIGNKRKLKEDKFIAKI